MTTDPSHARFMKAALAEARRAERAGEVPIGAVIVENGRIVARGANQTRNRRSPTRHAEIVAIESYARRVQNERLVRGTLYVTLEPCAMCAGAVVQARLPVLVFGCRDPKAGACGSIFSVVPSRNLNHRPTVIEGVLAEESAAVLRSFFRSRR